MRIYEDVTNVPLGLQHVSRGEFSTHHTDREYQREGSIQVIDEANVLPEQFSAETQAIIEQLIARGAEVVIFTTDNPQGIDTLELFNSKLAEQGFGSSADNTFDSHVLGCTLDYGNGKALCTIGARWGSALSVNELGRAEQLIIENAGGGEANNEQAIRMALEYLFSEIAKQEQQEQAAQQNAEATATTGMPSHPEPQQPSFLQENATAIGSISLSIAVLAGLLGAEFKLRRPKAKRLLELKGVKDTALERWATLNNQTISGGGVQALEALISDLKLSYPEESQKYEQLKANLLVEVAALADKKTKLDAVKFGLFTGKDMLRELELEYQALEATAIKLLEPFTEAKVAARDVERRKQEANDRLQKARDEFDTLENWYTEQRAANSQVLPEPDVALKQITDKLELAIACVLYDPGKELLGSDIALEVSGLITEFQKAIREYVRVVDISKGLIQATRGIIEKWPGETVQLEELANPGLQRLTKAAAEISDDLDFKDITAETARAETEFTNARNFANLLSETLRQRAQNSEALQKFYDEQYSESHVSAIRDQATQLRNQANAAGSQGDWASGESLLSASQERDLSAVSIMRSLDQTRKDNETRLRALSSNVAAAQQRHAGDLAARWNDLQNNFAVGNFIDFQGHYNQASALLNEAFDNPADDADLASDAGRRNSMDEQKFIEAEGLIATAERKLSQAGQLMDQLEQRHEFAKKARDQYKMATTNAADHIQKARDAKAGKFDRLVSPNVDDVIREAAKKYEEAQDAAEHLIYTTALERANEATQLAFEARNEAEGDIARVNALYKEKERTGHDAITEVKEVERTVDSEADAVVSQSTLNELRALKNLLSSTQSQETSLVALEDDALERGIQDIISAYNRASESEARSVLQHLESDRANHRQALERAKSAIREAESARSSARTKCSNSRAGSAGDGILAGVSIPDEPAWGSTQSEINSVISRAQSAKSMAQQAESAAERHIQQVLDEEARIERERREAERRAQEKREAERRAQEQRERAAAESRRQASMSLGSQRSGGGHGGLRK